MSSDHVERRLAAILAADVAGSCRLIGIDEEGTLARLKALRRTIFDPKIAEHHGRVVKNTGDGAIAEFASVVDAVRCADEIQRGMAEQNIDVPQDKRIELRIGIHVGDIIIEENDIFGDGVNIAVRLEGIAEPGGISISDDARRQIRGKVDVTFEDLGSQSLKNIAEPMGDKYRVHFLNDVYFGSHIDSTLVALRPGLVLANPARVNDDTLPKILKQWKVIYSSPMENTDRYDADYLSRSIGSDWIDMNAFSVNPNLVVVDRNQPSLIKLLEKEGLDVIPLKLRHSKLLGGGPHCVTLDVRRNGTLQRYFD